MEEECFAWLDAEEMRRGILRCMDIPQAVFRKEPLEILRCLRYMAEYGLTAELLTDVCLRAGASGLRSLPPEQIFPELCGMLMGKDVTRVLMQYGRELGVCIPEILPCLAFEQHSRHHDFSVWEHIARSVGNAAPLLPVRLVMLMHDMGKPSCYTSDARGGHFKGHAQKSAEMAEQILIRLHCESSLIETIVLLIDRHRVIPKSSEEMEQMRAELGEERFWLYQEVLKADAMSKRANGGRCPQMSCPPMPPPAAKSGIRATPAGEPPSNAAFSGKVGHILS